MGTQERTNTKTQQVTLYQVALFLVDSPTPTITLKLKTSCTHQHLELPCIAFFGGHSSLKMASSRKNMPAVKLENRGDPSTTCYQCQNELYIISNSSSLRFKSCLCLMSIKTNWLFLLSFELLVQLGKISYYLALSCLNNHLPKQNQ